MLMERVVFARLDFVVVVPNPWWFGSRLTRNFSVSRTFYCLMRYFLELTLLDHTFLYFRPSVLAAASFFLTSIILDEDYGGLEAETSLFLKIFFYQTSTFNFYSSCNEVRSLFDLLFRNNSYLV